MKLLKEWSYNVFLCACYGFGLVLGLVLAALMMWFSYAVYPYP